MVNHGCMICHDNMIFLNTPEDSECFYCHETFGIQIKCANGHYICDKCHNMTANDLISTHCVKSNLENPFELAVNLMKNPKIKMHGPEHHFLVPAVLLAAFYNKKKAYEEKENKINQARKKAEKIPDDICCSHGNCRTAIGSGIFIGLITDTTPLSKSTYEKKLSNLITSKSLYYIANYKGPPCCKRNSFLAIQEAVTILNEVFGMTMQLIRDMQCEFSDINDMCGKNECLFYKKGLM